MMHPLAAALTRYRNLVDIEPRKHGLYWPMWKKMEAEERAFIRELGFDFPLSAVFASAR